MRSFRSLIERQIAKARAAGGLTGLKGEGAPLPDRPVETGEQAAVSTAMRIMAEAGVVPEEFTLKTQLDAARKAYADAPDADTRTAAMAQLADLELRYEIAREARRKFMS
ncbi:DnaJ family domain-containing protein [Roseobacter sp.]|uniref:DnaJ family domain-containing protein n=1 Tax=Roseobacter sp. TaxID=1907202 RepID=UPI002966F840|nr:DnaJ family domain-containing protein [Roseobacter sp.]MDW3183822.1 DnaJ family domain-containing protein [Roseobacter sp.]